MAVELLCGAEGIAGRAPLRPAAGTSAVVDVVRSRVPPLSEDRPIGADIEAVAGLISEGAFDGLM